MYMYQKNTGDIGSMYALCNNGHGFVACTMGSKYVACTIVSMYVAYCNMHSFAAEKQTPRSKEPSIDLVTFRKRIYLEKCWRENPQRGSEYVCPVIYMYIYIVSIYWVCVLMHVSNSPSKVLGVWSHNCWVEIELTCAITSFAPWQAWLAG